MGSNIVRLTDRKYMLKLMSKIQQDHETKQQIRIEERMVIILISLKKQKIFTKLYFINIFDIILKIKKKIKIFLIAFFLNKKE